MTATEKAPRFDRMPEYKALWAAQQACNGPTQCAMLVDWLTEWCVTHDDGSREAKWAAKDLKQEQDRLKDHYAAVALADRLKQIDVEQVPAMSEDRGICRKEQARLTRELFKKLGLKGISVTTPMYSMASTVDVRIPKQLGEMRRDSNVHATWEEYLRALDLDPVIAANRFVEDRIKEILAYAFPNHDDRSDYMTDYYNSKWSVN